MYDVKLEYIILFVFFYFVMETTDADRNGKYFICLSHRLYAKTDSKFISIYTCPLHYICKNSSCVPVLSILNNSHNTISEAVHSIPTEWTTVSTKMNPIIMPPNECQEEMTTVSTEPIIFSTTEATGSTPPDECSTNSSTSETESIPPDECVTNLTSNNPTGSTPPDECLTNSSITGSTPPDECATNSATTKTGSTPPDECLTNSSITGSTPPDESATTATTKTGSTPPDECSRDPTTDTTILMPPDECWINSIILLTTVINKPLVEFYNQYDSS